MQQPDNSAGRWTINHSAGSQNVEVVYSGPGLYIDLKEELMRVLKEGKHDLYVDGVKLSLEEAEEFIESK